MTVRHDSDCAVHNEPAEMAGPCDCSVSRAESVLRDAVQAEITDPAGDRPA